MPNEMDLFVTLWLSVAVVDDKIEGSLYLVKKKSKKKEKIENLNSNMMHLFCLFQKCGLCGLLQGLTVAWQSESAKHREGQSRWHIVITQNACYINKLRSCFQFGPNYMVLTGHRGKKQRSYGRLQIMLTCPTRGLC